MLFVLGLVMLDKNGHFHCWKTFSLFIVKISLGPNSPQKLALREKDCPSLIRKPGISSWTDVGCIPFIIPSRLDPDILY